MNNQLNALIRQTKEDRKRFEESIGDLKKGVEKNKAEIKETKRGLNEEQGSIRLSLAQLEADNKEIRDHIRTLTGKVEENNHLLKDTIEEDINKEDYMVSQVKQLTSRVQELSSRIERVENHVGLEPPAEKEEVEVRETLTEKKPEKPAPVEAAKKPTESSLYEKTLGLFREDRYDEAIEGFKEFLKMYPGSDLADNAHFWIGECYRMKEDYEKAILAYQKVINGYPKGNKVPSALLHQAYAFEELNDETTSNLIYKKLVKNHPETREAEIARKRLGKD